MQILITFSFIFLAIVLIIGITRIVFFKPYTGLLDLFMEMLLLDLLFDLLGSVIDTIIDLID